METIKAWSMSRLAVWEECPRRAYYKFIKREPERGGGNNVALERGKAIHTAAEQFIKGQVKNLAPALQPVKRIVTSLRAAYKKKLVRAEYEMALDRNWNPTGWFDPDVYVRVKADILRLQADKSTALVIDWKTGKFKEVDDALGRAYDDALNLYSVAVLSLGFARQASAQLIFTDLGKIVSRERGTVSLRVLGQEQKRWDKRVRPMLEDEIYPTHPAKWCDYCPFTANKGGPCEF